MDKQIQAARAAVNAETFGTPAWEAAMQKVRALVAEQTEQQPTPSLNVILAPISRTRYRAIKAGQ